MNLFASIIDSIQISFPSLIEYKYLFLLVVVSIEGFTGIILAGFMASLGTVAILPAVLVCVAGDFLNGLGWYVIGYFGGSKLIDKWSSKKSKRRSIIEKVQHYFHHYSGQAIIFTKLTWSLTIVTMVMAGALKYNFKKFSFYNLIGGIGWVAITFTVGYVFGRGYKSIAIVNNIGFAILFFVVAIALIYGLKVFLKSRFIKSINAIDHFRDLGEKIRDGIDKLVS